MIKHMNLPDEFIKRMNHYFPEEVEALFAALARPNVKGLRANTLKISPVQLSGLTDMPLESVKWCEEGFYCAKGWDKEARPGKSPYYHAGLFYIQEPSAMSAAAILDVSPGDRVLDICSAPGGKATQIAARLHGKGLLVANDVRSSRCGGLIKNMELAGATNCLITNEAPERLAETFGSFFDKILVDAPCSGEAMFRKDYGSIKDYGRYKTGECTAIQKSVLYHTAGMLRPGGRLMYSTCTFSPEENECVIGDFLEKIRDFHVVPIDHVKYGFDKGRAEFYKDSMSLTGCARLWPHKIEGDGHFLALLEKDGEREFGNTARLTASGAKGRATDAPFMVFCEEQLQRRFEGRKLLRGSSLYLACEGLPELKGLRVLREGFYLGEIKGTRFEPSQALALGLKKEDAKNALCLSAEDERVLRYLKGESFEADTVDGYVLVCIKDWPLGWGKAQNGRLKNKYPTGWVLD